MRFDWWFYLSISTIKVLYLCIKFKVIHVDNMVSCDFGEAS